MDKFTKGITIAVVAISLTACSAFQSDLNSVLSSAAGQSIIAALGAANGTLNGDIQNVVTAVDNGLASGTTQDALKTVCYTLPWADAGLDLFGPVAGVDATIIASTDAAVKAFETGPCTTPPTTLATVITEGVQLFMNIEGQLSSNGVPVMVPTSRTITAHSLK